MKPVIQFTSPDSPTVIYACGSCKLTSQGGLEQAERCCSCSDCGGPRTERYRTRCEHCSAEATRLAVEARRAKALALPVITEHNGPVYVDDFDNWFEDVGGALDACHDEGIEPGEVIAYPGAAHKATFGSLVDHIEEAWYEQVPEDCDCDIPDGLAQKLRAVADEIAAAAPTYWEAVTTVRLQLAHPEETA